MSTHDLFSLSLYRLTVVSAGIMATLLLTGCPDADFGEADTCICVDDPILIFFQPPGSSITTIEKASSFLPMGYPGAIIKWEVFGGDDGDVVYDTAVDPLDGCGDGCPPLQDCKDAFDNSSQVCVTVISNRNTPYNWSVSGYVNSYEEDPDTTIGLSEICYVELVNEYIETAAEFTVSVVRPGASQAEFQGENYGSSEFRGMVLPPPQFTLSSIRHSDTNELPLSGPSEEASELLREDKSQNPAVDQGSLKKRKNDPSDNSVGVDYRVVHEYEDDSVPIDFDATNPDHIDKIYELRSRGIDILVVNHIYLPGYPAPPQNVNSGIRGCAYPALDFFLLSSVETGDVKRTFIHEIGHCVGLNDNELLVPYNIMLSGSGLPYGMDVHSNFSQNIKFRNGSADWHD